MSKLCSTQYTAACWPAWAGSGLTSPGLSAAYSCCGKKAIRWHIPVSFLLTLALCAALGWLFSPATLASPQLHLLSGATMLGAFFILTDPVTASTTNRGRLIFGALAGVLVWLIRSFGGYPDGVAFAVLLANITVPLIDYYTRPRVYGHRKG
nr:Electron transport complex protein RnfD [Salmonella sp. NCTC 7297]